MAIYFSSDSHLPHITGSNIDVSTQYFMDRESYFAGVGQLIDNTGNIIDSNFILPTIGTKYIDYYFLSNLVGTYWEDIVLNDITPEHTTAKNVVDPVISDQGWDLNKMVLITFTWTNTAQKDIVTPGDQSSIKFVLDTNTQLETTELVLDVDGGTTYLASDLFFTKTDPIMYYYFNDDNGDPQSESRGNYTDTGPESAAERRAFRQYHRQNNDSPSHEVYTTNTILIVTIYSKWSANYSLCDNQNKINSEDFLNEIYGLRETRLNSKGRQPTDAGNDLNVEDDTFRWLFDDYTKVESGIDMYKYELIFKYKPDLWTKWYGSNVNEYEQINFKTVLLDPLFNTGI